MSSKRAGIFPVTMGNDFFNRHAFSVCCRKSCVVPQYCSTIFRTTYIARLCEYSISCLVTVS